MPPRESTSTNTDRPEGKLPVLYGLLYGMPGIPTVYYGSEWGIKGDKKEGDRALRPSLFEPKENELRSD